MRTRQHPAIVVTHEIGFAGAPRDVLADPQHERTKAFVSKVL